MRDLTVNEIDMVSGGGIWDDFWSGIGESFQIFVQNTYNAVGNWFQQNVAVNAQISDSTINAINSICQSGQPVSVRIDGASMTITGAPGVAVITAEQGGTTVSCTMR